ncbi:hypothetical protein NKI39_11475 [Mesorhizobium sp. M0664]|uniref:hypothetical protein n=1 Tax=Mesorhizobium sp. M0664 TaxID=2956982 RepID=UPI003337F963
MSYAGTLALAPAEDLPLGDHLSSLMTREEAEQGVRYFCTKWAEERGDLDQPENPRCSDFFSWLEQKSPGHLKFRSSTSVRGDVERWFIDEFKQGWRH